MSRRKNELNERELALLGQENGLREYVESFKEAISLFVQDCELRNLRSHTIKYYLNEFNAFLSNLTEQGIDTQRLKPYNFTEEHVKENVILYMKNYKGNKIVTINTRLRALRAFFNFLYNQKHIPNNPMENIKLLKDIKSIIATFTKDKLRQLFKQPDLKTFTGIRDYTIMMLMLETGIRVNELVGLSLNDVRWEDGLICVRNAKSYRERLVPIQSECER